MKKDEIIELLKEQIKGLRDDNNRLLDQIDALIKEVSSLKEALLQTATGIECPPDVLPAHRCQHPGGTLVCTDK